MSEMIVVGITNTDRTRDLTPTKATGPNAAQFPTAGGADNFLKFIETEVIPEIEKRYRVQPYRVLAGHSFGGLFAVHALITRPELFNSYVAVSPSLQWSDDATLKRAEEFFKTRKELRATLFTSLGNEPGDIGKAFEQFKQLLAKNQIKGFEWEAQQMTDEDHGSVVLRSHYFGSAESLCRLADAARPNHRGSSWRSKGSGRPLQMADPKIRLLDSDAGEPDQPDWISRPVRR